MTQLYRETCLVEIATNHVWQKMLHSNGASKSEDSIFSSSGIIISPRYGYVLTHGSILLTHFTKNKILLKRLLSVGHIPSKSLKGLRALVTMETVMKDKDSVTETDRNLKALCNSTTSKKISSKCEQHMGSIELIWRANNFAKAVQIFMPSSDQWSFFEDPDKGSNLNDVDPDLVANLLPYFVLMKLDNWTSMSGQELTQIPLCEGDVNVGDVVHMVGTPFGSMSPSVFMNSVSQGVVCNAAGKHQELLVTDARCIPGTEGGPLYYGATNQRCCLLGVVASALCWKANEWIGLSMVCNISEVIHSLSEVIQLPEIFSSVQKVQPKSVASSFIPKTTSPDQHPVVLVTVGSTWGSGIIIDQKAGIVLTCGHVVKNARGSVKVRVDFPTMMWFEARVLHATPLNYSFDIGVLKLKGYEPISHWENQVTVAENVVEGDESFVIGHAMFGHQHHLPPSVTRGVISKIITAHEAPVMIQSTCTVNAGASGGPLVSSDGKVIGIVTCNARDTGSGAAYPHINLSVPLKTIWPVLEKYLECGDPSVLDTLQFRNDDVINLWAMRGSKRDFEALRSKL